LLRISRDSNIEREYWIEKFNLFGFKKVAEVIKEGCIDSIRNKVSEIKGIKSKLLKCKYWTATERLVIKSWIDGKLEKEKVKDR